MIVTEGEQSALHAAILAFWKTLGIDGDPSPSWRRWVYRLLFGSPLLAPEDVRPEAEPMSPYEVIADAQDVLPILDFHLSRLVDYPHGALAGLLLERIKRISERALECHYLLRMLEETDDRQAA